MQPDRFFTAAQIRRLRELMERFQAAGPSALIAVEQAEMNALIEAELLASAQRTSTLADTLGRC